MIKNGVIVILIGIILVAGAVFLMNRQQAPQTPASTEGKEGVVITLTDKGFQPSEVSIKKGETVTFKTTAGELFWPASNLHPSHLLYPEFDPKEPIQPDASWSFTFETAGVWKFHDHLAPYFTGTITVTEQ